MQITSSGFQFLLHSPHAQLWELLLQYLHMAEVRLFASSSRLIQVALIPSIGASNGSSRGIEFPLHAVHHGVGPSTFQCRNPLSTDDLTDLWLGLLG